MKVIQLYSYTVLATSMGSTSCGRGYLKIFQIFTEYRLDKLESFEILMNWRMSEMKWNEMKWLDKQLILACIRTGKLR